MTGRMQNDAENTAIRRAADFEAFIRWSALPYGERRLMGIMDQNDFAKEHGLNITTLSRWKQRPDFEERIESQRRDWGRGKTPDVMQGIYNAAMKGNAKSQKLWMEYFTDFKVGEGKKRTLPVLSEEDIRYFISLLPEDLQTKYYSFLVSLQADVRAQQDGRFDDMSNSPDYHGL